MEKICQIAEEAARKHISSRVPHQGISDLTVAVDLEGAETLNVNVDVEVTLSPHLKNMSVKELAKGSVKAAFEAIEKYLEEYGCQQEK
jgi:hypothetical protein